MIRLVIFFLYGADGKGYGNCNEVDFKLLLERTFFFLFRKGVPPLLTVSVTVLDLLSRDFPFFVFGLLFPLDLDLDFGVDLGFTVLMSKYT